MRVRFCSGERFLLGVEKPIDDDGIALSRVPRARAHSFAIDHIRAAVYGHTCRIGKDDFARIRNFLWINSAMPFTVVHRSRMRARPNLRDASKP